MTALATRSALLLAAAGLSLFAVLKTQGNTDSHTPDLSYSTTGNGPSILLLHNSSRNDLVWAETARSLASHFEVTLVDVSEILEDPKAIPQLRFYLKELDLDDCHIAGSANGDPFALRYALSYPSQSRHFVLPQNSDDLQILADIVNSNPFKKS